MRDTAAVLRRFIRRSACPAQKDAGRLFGLSPGGGSTSSLLWVTPGSSMCR